jgi:nitroreductase
MPTYPAFLIVKEKMNLVIETIKTRQSVRLYELKFIPKDIIYRIIEAGNLAPSTEHQRFVEEEG